MIKNWLEEKLKQLYPDAKVDVLIPPDFKLGDFSTNVAFILAKAQKRNPIELGQELVVQLSADPEFQEKFEKIEFARPGFINFFIKKSFLQKQLVELAADESLGSLKIWKGKKILVEFTDPNPFKQFHIGHLMTNAIGESIARLCEAAGAEVLRLNYQGDVGIHVACSIWGMKKLQDKMPSELASLKEKVAFLGQAYVAGAGIYKEEGEAKAEINEINKKVYEKSDAEINELYRVGRQWSLDYFETMYTRLGTKFSNYFFESEVAQDGLDIVKSHPDIFVESQGAVIFPGEKYGLHSRVFISTAGMPTYEAKELGLNKKKFDLYHPDISLIVTANEINDYFRVLLKAMELVVPQAASVTRHIGHGLLRLTTGKMSSRTGDVITAESLIDQMRLLVEEKLKDRGDLSSEEKEKTKEGVALAAIKYSILKQEIGGDIIFDSDRSIAFHGDSGPYLQYTYARLNNILSKIDYSFDQVKIDTLVAPEEIDLMRHLGGFSEVISDAATTYSPNKIATYSYDLATIASRFYESVRILEDENKGRQQARLLLVQTTTQVLQKGLALLGIKTLERI
jgi:arginyl-tRNA synthetase